MSRLAIALGALLLLTLSSFASTSVGGTPSTPGLPHEPLPTTSSAATAGRPTVPLTPAVPAGKPVTGCSGYFWAPWVNAWYTNNCYGHDEPTFTYWDTTPGSGADASWKITLPADGPSVAQGDAFATFWFGGVVNDANSLGGQAFLEWQFYPLSPTSPLGSNDCTSTGSYKGTFTPGANLWFSCIVVWQIVGNKENAAFGGPMDANSTTNIFTFHSGDDLIANMTGVTNGTTGWTLSVKDMSAPRDKTTGAIQWGSTTLVGSGGATLAPYFSASDKCMYWGADCAPAVDFAYEIGHTYASGYGGATCGPAAGSICGGYDYAAWQGLPDLKLSVPVLGISGAGSYPVNLGFTSSYPTGATPYKGLPKPVNASSCGSPTNTTSCIYPWYSYEDSNLSYDFGVDHAWRNYSYGWLSQFPSATNWASEYLSKNWRAPWANVTVAVTPGTATVTASPGPINQTSWPYAGGAITTQMVEGWYWINVSNVGCTPSSAHYFFEQAKSYLLNIVLNCGAKQSVTFGVSPQGAGTIYFNGGPEYQGSTASVSAGFYSLSQIATSGWHFSSWATTGGVTVSNGGVWVNSSGSLTADYVAYPIVAFTTSPSSCGPITFNGTPFASGVSWPFYASATAYAFSVPSCASLTFQGWWVTGGLTVGSPTSLSTNGVLSANATLQANFTGSLTVHFGLLGPPGSGAVWFNFLPYYNGQSTAVSPGTYALGEIPNLWSHFVAWSSTSGITLASGSATVAASGWINATYELYPAVGFTVLPAFSPCTTLAVNGTTYSTGTSGRFFTSPPSYALSAATCGGYSFINWTGDVNLTVAASFSATTTANLTGNATLTANYAPTASTFSITFNVNAPSEGAIDFGGALFFNGGTARVAAGTYSLGQTTTPGWHFVQWYAQGNVVVGAGNVSVSAPTGPAGDALSANYTAYPLVRLSWTPSTCGPVTFNGTAVANGSALGYYAAPPHAPYSASVPSCAGATFTSWVSTGGVSVSSPSSLSTAVNVSANGTLEAEFTPNPYATVTFGISPVGAGVFVVGGVSYYDGSTASLARGNDAFTLNVAPYAHLASLRASGGVSIVGSNLVVTGRGWVNASFTLLAGVAVQVNAGGCAPHLNGSAVLNSTVWFVPGSYSFATTNCSWLYFPPILATAGGVTLASGGTQVSLTGNGSLSLTYDRLLYGNLTGPSSATAGSAVTLGSSVSGGTPGGEGYTWVWFWGDGTKPSWANLTSRAPSASHTFASAGSYTVTLRINDTDGQTIWRSFVVTVSACTGSCAGPQTKATSLETYALLALLAVIVAALLLWLYVRRRRTSRTGAEEETKPSGLEEPAAAGATAASEEKAPAPEASPTVGPKEAGTSASEPPASTEPPQEGAPPEPSTSDTPSPDDRGAPTPSTDEGEERSPVEQGTAGPPAPQTSPEDEVTVEGGEEGGPEGDAPDI
ncbi:MAG: PKD domain-containing protein [Euryarchaeota archaeon]|nr:PKD domain-containing protein [Euryarchaeota archaeon]